MTTSYIHVSCKSTCDCILQWLAAPLYVTTFRPFLEESNPASKIIASFYQLCVLQLTLILSSPRSANIPTMQASMVSWFSTREALAASRITTSLSTSFENIPILLLSTACLLKVRVPVLFESDYLWNLLNHLSCFQFPSSVTYATYSWSTFAAAG